MSGAGSSSHCQGGMDQRISPTAPVQLNHLKSCEELHCCESPSSHDENKAGKNPKAASFPPVLLSFSALGTQPLQSTIFQPHLPVSVTGTGLCWVSTSSGLNKLGVSRTLPQPLSPTGEVKGPQPDTSVLHTDSWSRNQPDGALVTCPPQSMAGGQLVTTHSCASKLQEALGGLFPSLSRGLCWEPRFLETFANRDAEWQHHGGQCIRGWFCPAEHLPFGLTRGNSGSSTEP